MILYKDKKVKDFSYEFLLVNNFTNAA